MQSIPAAAGHFTVLDSEQMYKKWTPLVEGRALGMFFIPSSWDLTHLPQCIFLFSDKNSAKEENVWKHLIN